jgi:predicted ester cyclase
MPPDLAANKHTVKRYPLAVAAGDLDVLDELCTADVVSHAPLGEPRGIDAHKAYEAPVHEAFPDFDVTYEDVVAEGDRVAMRFSIRATHDGELMGVAPTGREIAFQNVVFNRLVDGRIAERWVQPQLFDLMAQLGVVDDPRG